MCLSKISTEELLKEISKRNITTNSKFNETTISKKSFDGISIIFTYGKPSGEMKCRECKETKDVNCFSFYQSRVDSNGFLMRSNALCCDCSETSNKQRKEVLDNAIIPSKPKKGDVCSNCEREWSGNWHRHHVGNKFVAYICGHCNMSFSDQRNKKKL
jgi:hypothetical protein